jgi:hypothetical protein
MMRKIVLALILIPLAVLIVAICLANKADVRVSLDPFSVSNPAFARDVPLYQLCLTLLVVGVLVGGFATWLKQSKWRRGARAREAELRAARGEVDRLRRELAARETAAAPPLALRPPAA